MLGDCLSACFQVSNQGTINNIHPWKQQMLMPRGFNPLPRLPLTYTLSICRQMALEVLEKLCACYGDWIS